MPKLNNVLVDYGPDPISGEKIAQNIRLQWDNDFNVMTIFGDGTPEDVVKALMSLAKEINDEILFGNIDY
jgi:hypothetical protein